MSINRRAARWCSVPLLVVVIVVALTASTATALLGVPGAFDVSVHYDVVFSPNPITSREALSLPPNRLYPIRQSNGSSYICQMPPTEEELVVEVMEECRQRTAAGLVPEGFARGDLVPWEVSGPLHDAIASKGCMRFSSANHYWTNTICLGRFIRQEHVGAREFPADESAPPPPRSIETFTVGATTEEWERAKRPRTLAPDVSLKAAWETQYTFERDHEGAYFSSLYPMGDSCELTSKRRVTEVQIRCPDYSRIDEKVAPQIQEMGTCSYVVKIYDERACEPGLLQQRTRNLAIVCHPIVPEDQSL